MKGKLTLLLTCLLLSAPLCAAEEAPPTGAWVLEGISLDDGLLAFGITDGGGEVELALEPDGSAMYPSPKAYWTPRPCRTTRAGRWTPSRGQWMGRTSLSPRPPALC